MAKTPVDDGVRTKCLVTAAPSGYTQHRFRAQVARCPCLVHYVVRHHYRNHPGFNGSLAFA